MKKLLNIFNVSPKVLSKISFKLVSNFINCNKILIFNLLLFVLFVIFSPYIFFIFGNKYFGEIFYNRDYAKMFYHISRFSSFVTFRSDIQGVNYQLSRVYFVEGDLNSSLYYIDQELSLYSGFKRSHYVKGLILGYMNRKDEAIKQFEIFNSQPQFKNSWAGHNDQAWLEYDLQRYEDVLVTLDKVLPYHAYNPWILNTYAAALIKLNRCNQAIDFLNVASINSKLLTPEIWGRAYPGNNPKSYEKGLGEMINIIKDNLSKAKECAKS